MEKHLRFAEKINIEFNNTNLIKEALTHSSFKNENKGIEVTDNERLEFFGDSVLGLVISEYLFNELDLPEGNLTKIRSAIVCEEGLSEFARLLDIGNFICFGKGELANGGKTRPSILSDAVEAVIGAIYLDAGYEVVRDFVLQNFTSYIRLAMEGKKYRDYKTALQEKLHVRGITDIKYEVVSDTGPSHKKVFEVEVAADGKALGRGIGKNKKEAEQNAAKEAITVIDNEKIL